MNSIELVHNLKEAARLYYTTGKSPMTDEEYDAAIELLRKTDPSNKYLSEIGPTPDGSLRKIYHTIPMGTLSKYHTVEDVTKWVRENTLIDTYGVMLSPKYDGFGVELVYIQGKLVSASTRGNGRVGEDILDTVLKVPNIPHQLSISIDVIIRGEAIIPQEYREFLERKGYKSLRNAVPGIMRSLESDETLVSKVHFVAYNAFSRFFVQLHTQESIRRALESYGFEVESYVVSTSMQGLRERYEFIRDNVGTYEYDGVVLKDNKIESQKTTLEPTSQIAWKFQSKVQVTPLRSVEYQLGATGKFTPIAVFDPVVFQGATLTRASLGSYARFISLIKDEGLCIGAQLAVTRQGDIIPYVKEVVSCDENQTPIELLEVCPYCGHKLYVDDKVCSCNNVRCPKLLELKISSFVGCVKVKGIGGGIVTKLIEAGYLKSVSDIYEIEPEKVELQGWGASMTEKWRAFQNKKLTLLEIMSFYPFDNCGTAVWKKILDAFSDDASFIDYLKYYPSSTINDRFEILKSMSIKGIGEERLREIVNQVTYNSFDLLKVIEKSYLSRT